MLKLHAIQTAKRELGFEERVGVSVWDCTWVGRLSIFPIADFEGGFGALQRKSLHIWLQALANWVRSNFWKLQVAFKSQQSSTHQTGDILQPSSSPRHLCLKGKILFYPTLSNMAAVCQVLSTWFSNSSTFIHFVQSGDTLIHIVPKWRRFYPKQWRIQAVVHPSLHLKVLARETKLLTFRRTCPTHVWTCPLIFQHEESWLDLLAVPGCELYAWKVPLATAFFGLFGRYPWNLRERGVDIYCSADTYAACKRELGRWPSGYLLA